MLERVAKARSHRLSRSPQRFASSHQSSFWLAFQRKSPWLVTTPGYLKTGTKSCTSDYTCQESLSLSCATRASSSWVKWLSGASWDNHPTGMGPCLFVKVKKPTHNMGTVGPRDVWMDWEGFWIFSKMLSYSISLNLRHHHYFLHY